MSTPYTATSIIGQRLSEQLAPILTPDLARLFDSIGAIAEPLMSVLEETGLDGEAGYVPAYGKIFTATTCPAQYLPFLGNFLGVSIPVGASEAEARAIVKAESGLERGTEASMKAAIERAISRFWEPDTEFLKGQLVRHETTPGELACYEATATFTSGATFATTHLTLINIATQYELLPREKANGESSPYYFTVLVHPNQLLPEGIAGQLEGNVKATKPAGLVMEVVQTEEPLQTDPYIDEGTLLIEEVSAEILTATLANVT
jgi:Phage tail protein (Tail_P2_I)